MRDIHGLSAPPLTAEDEHALIAAIQSGLPAESEWERLIAAHSRAIEQAARRVGTMDAEDAYATALEAFVQAVRGFDLGLGFRLSTYAYPVMARAVMVGAGEDHSITLPADILRRYLALMKKADGDFMLAYRMAELGGHQISPFSMLAAHRALSDFRDAEVVLGEQKHDFRAYSDDLTGDGGNLTKSALRTLSYTPEPGHEEIDAGFVARMMAVVTPEQRQIVRIAYGFDPGAVDALRAAGELQTGNAPALVSDRAVGVHVGQTRGIVQRARTKALDTMRDTVQDRIDDAEGE